MFLLDKLYFLISQWAKKKKKKKKGINKLFMFEFTINSDKIKKTNNS